jgi:hypothetical protein
LALGNISVELLEVITGMSESGAIKIVRMIPKFYANGL